MPAAVLCSLQAAPAPAPRVHAEAQPADEPLLPVRDHTGRWLVALTGGLIACLSCAMLACHVKPSLTPQTFRAVSTSVLCTLAASVSQAADSLSQDTQSLYK
jgi:hypothetical protein